MAVWHHRLNGHEFEQALVVGDGQEAWSEYCSLWGCKELDTTERLNLLTLSRSQAERSMLKN